MAKLKPGAVTIDLPTGGIYGDLDHCPKEDLLESAEALLSLLPRVTHKELWGLSKDYDSGCYLHTTHKGVAPAGVQLEADIYRGTGGMPPRRRPFSLITNVGDRAHHWRFDLWSKLIGSVKDGQVTSDTDSIDNLVAEAQARMQAETEQRRAKSEEQRQRQVLEKGGGIQNTLMKGIQQAVTRRARARAQAARETRKEVTQPTQRQLL